MGLVQLQVRTTILDSAVLSPASAFLGVRLHLDLEHKGKWKTFSKAPRLHYGITYHLKYNPLLKQLRESMFGFVIYIFLDFAYQKHKQILY